MTRGARTRIATASIAVLLFLTGPLTAADATGAATGAVIDGMTGDPLRGARLSFEGIDVSVESDLDGIFRAEVPAGTYDVAVSKAGFETQRVTGVEVTAGKTTNFSLALLPTQEAAAGREGETTFKEQLTVTAEAETATAAALLTERKNAVEIVDSIGSEEMSKNTGSDAAGALRRVTGVSLQDSKYAYVRGLGDRYSNTMLDGARLPSTEFEKKVVPLDLFPDDLIEKISVSKSYTVDKPGDFGAGFVELVTRQFPLNQIASIGTEIGYNDTTTGEPYLRYGGGLSTSGRGGQPIPGSIPQAPLIRESNFSDGFTPAELEGFGEDLIGLWSPRERESAPYNSSFKATWGTSVDRFGILLGANYENGFATRMDEEVNIYSLSSAAPGGIEPLSTYLFDTTDESTRRALTGSLAYRIGNNHQLQARSLFTTLSSAESRFQEGFLFDINNNIEDQRLSYLDQEIENVQVSGDHFLADVGSGAMIEWRVAASDATTEENRRETLYGETTPGRFVLTQNAQSGFMYWNDLADDLGDAKINWESILDGETLHGSVKVGAARSESDRDFFGRRIRYQHRDTRGIDLTQGPEQLFVEEYIRPNGFEVEEITRPTDTYVGNHDINAGFAQADLGWGKWRLIAGARYEDSNLEVLTLDRNNPDLPTVETVLDDADVLPALSLVYSLTPATNLRFSASQTVNRPEYRELAPFKYTHVVGGYAVTGNPELQQAEIRSFDARWEWFPEGGEVVAASVFYKDFDNPIESVVITGAEFVESFENVDAAENIGAELEFRRGLDVIAESLSEFELIANYTWVDSQVTIDDAETAGTNLERPLVGQPDNVLNLILDWTRPQSDTGLRLLYNFVDDRIAFAGIFGLPDVIEEARSSLDFTFLQGLGSLADGLALKFSLTNLLDEERHWTQGGQTYRLYEPGIGTSLSISYSFL
jgi:hypothetical protein